MKGRLTQAGMGIALAAPLLFAACEVRTYDRPHYHRAVVYAPPPPQPVVMVAPAPPPPQPMVVVAPPPPPPQPVVVYAPQQPVYVEEAPAQQVFVASTPPPALIVERRPPFPRGHGEWVWVDGYYAISGNSWVWVKGRYAHPPRAGAVWIAPHWDGRGGNYRMTPGGWR